MLYIYLMCMKYLHYVTAISGLNKLSTGIYTKIAANAMVKKTTPSS